jgi:TatD DNase family protein
MADLLDRLPALGAATADSHAHLDMLEDPSLALERAARAGVSLIATVVDLTESPEVTLDGLDVWLAEASERLAPDGILSPEVRLVVGAHPHNASARADDHADRVRKIVADPRVGALGEIGLDFHYMHSPREVQIDAMREDLGLAQELGLPVIVHLREAHAEGEAVLRESGVPDAGCVLHCFTEGPDTVERFLEMGCMVSFAGPVTFRKAEAIREAARLVPLDRLLVETDCPFLAPEPFRGRRNEPAYVVLNAAAVSAAVGESTAVVARAAHENAARLFGRQGVPR